MESRTALAEAQRRVSQGRTLYKRMIEKHEQKEIEYRAKLARLEAELDRLTQEAK